MDKFQILRKVEIQEYTSMVRSRQNARKQLSKQFGNADAYKRRLCSLCQAFSEGYMLKDSVWEEAGLYAREIACPACVEKLLGRPLRITDFTDACVNTILRIGYMMGFKDGCSHAS